MTGIGSVITPLPADLRYVDDIGVQLIFTGNAVGTFELQTSIDYDVPTSNLGTWNDILLSYWNGTAFVTAYTIPTSLGSPIYLDLSVTSIPFLRILYSNLSGAGTYNGWVTGKGL